MLTKVLTKCFNPNL